MKKEGKPEAFKKEDEHGVEELRQSPGDIDLMQWRAGDEQTEQHAVDDRGQSHLLIG